MRQTTLVMDRQIANLKTELEDVKVARDRALAELEQLQASNQQLLNTTGQEAANGGMDELQRQLEQARQELAAQVTTSSTKTLVDHCAALEKELQGKDRQLQEACEAGGDPLLRAQLANIDGSVTRP